MDDLGLLEVLVVVFGVFDVVQRDSVPFDEVEVKVDRQDLRIQVHLLGLIGQQLVVNVLSWLVHFVLVQSWLQALVLVLARGVLIVLAVGLAAFLAWALG